MLRSKRKEWRKAWLKEGKVPEHEFYPVLKKFLHGLIPTYPIKVGPSP